MAAPFVPEDFEPPPGLRTSGFVLEPLGPQHNQRDHAAWTSSIEHIHATPGYDDEPDDPDPWPLAPGHDPVREPGRHGDARAALPRP